MIVNLSIDLLKLDQKKIKDKVLKSGKQARYLELTLIENRNGQDQYGNDGMVVQSTTKEERAAGRRGEILGNYKISGVRPDTGVPGTEDPGHDEGSAADTTDDEVPF